ncbi:MAG: D-2-hydroxyacid dehydrogenase [Lachnospiraceae bacterium]|nr:D-2-hydroxyacid dehydrogenase [Lachnospiraceae bacterium]
MKAVYLEEGAVNRGDLSLSPITSLIETKVYENTTEDDKYEHIGDAEVVFSNKIIFDEETFSKCPNLKYVGVCATGYNVIDVEAAKRHGVTVTNVPAYSTESVAQLTWGFILEHACHIGLHGDSVKNGEWVSSETFCYWKAPVTELYGKTIGIVGYGNIGRRVAEIALAFRMRVLVHTAHPEKYEAVEGLSFVDMETLFAESDIISLHCPMTEETKEIVRRENIEKMKDGVILINVSRGGLVNEADLYEALESGKVGYAACDVVSVEPMRADNPLLKAKNITITPHMAWASLEARNRLIEIVASNFKAFLEGKNENVVS